MVAIVLGILQSTSALLLEEMSFHLYPRARQLAMLFLPFGSQQDLQSQGRRDGVGIGVVAFGNGETEVDLVGEGRVDAARAVAQSVWPGLMPHQHGNKQPPLSFSSFMAKASAAAGAKLGKGVHVGIGVGTFQ